MAQFTVNAQRFDPYKNFKFRVKWDGRYVAGVSKVGALSLLAYLPEGPDLAKALRIALDAKDPMHYATDYLTPDRHTAVLRAATTLATAAQRMLPPSS